MYCGGVGGGGVAGVELGKVGGALCVILFMYGWLGGGVHVCVCVRRCFWGGGGGGRCMCICACACMHLLVCIVNVHMHSSAGVLCEYDVCVKDSMLLLGRKSVSACSMIITVSLSFLSLFFFTIFFIYFVVHVVSWL